MLNIANFVMSISVGMSNNYIEELVSIMCIAFFNKRGLTKDWYVCNIIFRKEDIF